MSLTLVDSNAHATAPPWLRDEFPLHPLADAVGNADETPEPTIEELVATMDAAGVAQALLIGSRNHGFDNSYCAHAGERYPERFATIASVDIFAPTAIEDVRHWVEERGMHGVRLWGGRRGPATWIDDERYLPVWRYVDELGLPVNAQMARPETLPGHRRLLERLPTLRLTVNNIGHVSPEGGATSEDALALLALADFPNVFANVSVQFLVAAAAGGPAGELFQAMLERFGSRRMMWSAFYPSPPNVDYPASAEAVRSAVGGLSPEDQEGICSGGTLALYPTLRAGQVPG
ncbi:MAG TPA: amidohydrolase family protein [Solirubrobacteraceae bacterium]|jgi:predicted TIM-barrel fold metal-dependent hydrolase|nr:amidohydrolase family protein [Solirubrobacteraceae bacterium]